jgi:hypothetical protein
MNYLRFSESLRRDLEALYGAVGKKASRVPTIEELAKALQGDGDE